MCKKKKKNNEIWTRHQGPVLTKSFPLILLFPRALYFFFISCLLSTLLSRSWLRALLLMNPQKKFYFLIKLQRHCVSVYLSSLSPSSSVLPPCPTQNTTPLLLLLCSVLLPHMSLHLNSASHDYYSFFFFAPVFPLHRSLWVSGNSLRTFPDVTVQYCPRGQQHKTCSVGRTHTHTLTRALASLSRHGKLSSVSLAAPWHGPV